MRRTHTELADRLEAIRQAERAQTRDMHTAVCRTPDEIAILAPDLDRNRDLHRADMVAGLNSVGKEVRHREWADELDQHNVKAKELCHQHVRQAQQRRRDQEPPVPAVQRDARGFEIDPAKVAELDLDKYRAVWDGRYLGWDSQGQVHTYQVPGKPPVRVAHDDEERRMAELTKNLNKGLTVEQIQTLELMEMGQALPVQEAAKTRNIDPPAVDRARMDELARERERQQEKEHGTGQW